MLYVLNFKPSRNQVGYGAIVKVALGYPDNWDQANALVLTEKYGRKSIVEISRNEVRNYGKSSQGVPLLYKGKVVFRYGEVWYNQKGQVVDVTFPEVSCFDENNLEHIDMLRKVKPPINIGNNGFRSVIVNGIPELKSSINWVQGYSISGDRVYVGMNLFCGSDEVKVLSVKKVNATHYKVAYENIAHGKEGVMVAQYFRTLRKVGLLNEVAKEKEKLPKVLPEKPPLFKMGDKVNYKNEDCEVITFDGKLLTIVYKGVVTSGISQNDVALAAELVLEETDYSAARKNVSKAHAKNSLMSSAWALVNNKNIVHSKKYAACYAQITLYMAGGIKNLSIFHSSYKRYVPEYLLETYFKVCNWIVNDSPFSKVFLTKNIGEGLEYGFEIDTTCSLSHIVTANTAMRNLVEHHGELTGIKWMLDKGFSVAEAFFIGVMIYKKEGDKKLYWHDPSSGHSIMNLSYSAQEYADKIINNLPMNVSAERWKTICPADKDADSANYTVWASLSKLCPEKDCLLSMASKLLNIKRGGWDAADYLDISEEKLVSNLRDYFEKVKK